MEKGTIIILVAVILIIVGVGAYYSFSSPSLAPRAIRNVTNAICGNGIIQPPEQCEISGQNALCESNGTCPQNYNLNGQTCQSLGFAGGTLSCANNCQFDTSGCYNNASCTDTDGGYNLLVRGNAYGFSSNDSSFNATDYCPGAPGYLMEYYCLGTQRYASNYTSCSQALGSNYTCQNGACAINQTNQTYLLTVSKTGTGQGTVTSNPAGINCGSDCTQNYVSGTSVILTATPNSTSTFNGWSGSGCSGTGTCAVVMNINRNVIANFSLNQTNQSLPDLTVINLTVTNKTLTATNVTGNGTIRYYSITMNANVKNIGAISAGTSNTRLEVVGFFPYQTVSTPVLAAGASTNVQAVLTDIPEGSKTARATADILNAVPESNENNNVLTTQFTLP